MEDQEPKSDKSDPIIDDAFAIAAINERIAHLEEELKRKRAELVTVILTMARRTAVGDQFRERAGDD